MGTGRVPCAHRTQPVRPARQWNSARGRVVGGGVGVRAVRGACAARGSGRGVGRER